MKESRDNLQAGEVSQANIRGSLPEKPSKVCASPARPEAEIRQAKASAKKLNIPFVDPLHAPIEPTAVSMLDPDVAMRRQALPVRLVNDTLLVAMASPDEPIAIKSLELLTGCKIRPAAAPRSSVFAALQQVYGQDERRDNKIGQEAFQTKEGESCQRDEKRAFSISVISNKGGVGKTHFSINLAYALAKSGAKVLLIDADLGSADISNKLAIFPEHHLMDFLEKDKEMQGLVVATDYNFDLIGGTYGEFKLANLYYAQKIKFIKHFKKVSEDYDFAVFDLSAGIGRTVLDFALGTDRTVIITTPQDLISGYACAKASFYRYKEIEEKLEGKSADYTPQWTFSPMLVINQVSDIAHGAKLYAAIEKTADENINANEGRFRIRTEYLGAILYDKESMRAVEEKKKPLLVDRPHIKASQCIQHMSEKFCVPEGSYDPRIRFKHPFKRFVAILSQKT